MWILDKINANNDYSQLSSFEDDGSLERTVKINTFLEPIFKQFIKFYKVGEIDEKFYKLAFDSIVFNLGREDNYGMPFFDINDIVRDIDNPDDLCEVLDVLIPSMNTFKLYFEKPFDNHSNESESFYLKNSKNPSEKIEFETLKLILKDLVEKKLNECVLFLQGHFRLNVNIENYYSLYKISVNQKDEKERIDNILESVLGY